MVTSRLTKVNRVVISLLAAIVIAAGLTTIRSAAAYASSTTFSAPVYAGDFPDPSIILVNGTYWAFATTSAGRNLQVMNSPDLHTWSPITDPLPVLPSWASIGPTTWAPGVLVRGATFVMYYTARDASNGQECLSIATSAVPGGPYTDTSTGPLICQSLDGGSIDPNPYLDPASGNLFLLWKSNDPALGAGHPSKLWGEQLTANGRAWAAGTTPSLLLVQSRAWQSPTIEGPTVIRQGGRYYLFYGANSYDAASSGIGYATSSKLLGTYTNDSTNGPWLGTSGNAQGPQGPSIFTDASGVTRMAFAAWDGKVGYENGGVRSLWVGTLGFNLFGTPTLN